MCLFEYDEKKAMEAEREEGIEEGIEKGRKEGIEEGRKEGRKEGMENAILEMVREGFLPIEEAAKKLNITVEEVKEKLKK